MHWNLSNIEVTNKYNSVDIDTINVSYELYPTKDFGYDYHLLTISNTNSNYAKFVKLNRIVNDCLQDEDNRNLYLSYRKLHGLNQSLLYSYILKNMSIPVSFYEDIYFLHDMDSIYTYLQEIKVINNDYLQKIIH